jgi:endonuclease I
MNQIKTFLSLFVFFLFVQVVFGQIPDGYYDEAEGLTGDELKTALHNIIKDHVEYSYDDLRDFLLRETDEDPNNSNNVILFYTGRSQDKNTFGGNSDDWNREHVWAKSHGDFGTTPPAGTDCHHMKPTDASVNSTRGNLDFDMGGSPVAEAPGCYKDSDSFEPRDAVKGDVARMLFYMAVRYEGGNGEPDLEVVDEVNTSPKPEHGKLSVLLQWNDQDPPDDFEMNRNEVIYSYQENRNPFIDHPEYVQEIWGDPSAVSENGMVTIACYPNPVLTDLYIEFSKNTSLTYSFYFLDGKKVKAGNLQAGKSTVSLQGFQQGLYILMINDKSGNMVGQYKIQKLN